METHTAPIPRAAATPPDLILDDAIDVDMDDEGTAALIRKRSRALELVQRVFKPGSRQTPGALA